MVGLDRDLSLGPSTTSMRSLGVARELEHLVVRQLKNLLDTTADVDENFLALLRGPALSTGHIAIAATRNALADGTGPDTDTVEGLADVDDHAHDLTVLLLLHGVTNGSQHDVHPQVIDVDAALLLELVGPLAAVLVLGVFPFGSYAGLEEVVIGLEGEVGDGCDVVLGGVSFFRRWKAGQVEGGIVDIRRYPRTPRPS